MSKIFGSLYFYNYICKQFYFITNIIAIMKKFFSLSLMLMAALAVNAQLKVAPKMQMGDQKNYVTTTVAKIPGQGTLTITDETTISVAEVLSEGFVLSVETTKVTSDAQAGNIAGLLMSAAQEMMAGVEIRVNTDLNGQPQGIANYTDVKAKLEKNSDQLVDKMLQSVPQIAQVMGKDALKKHIMDNVSEKSLLAAMKNSTCPLVLNGKTLTTGAQEDYTNEQGLKMKRMYFVNGQKVTSSGSINMSKEDMKALIIKQVEQMMPEQAEMIKQNIDQVMASGLVKIDMKETASYDLDADGWLKSINSESTMDSMGQQTNIKATVTLK